MHTIAEPIAPTPEGERATPIAIVGLACRFPDADDPLTLFESALAGRRSFRRLPPGRAGTAAGGPPPRAALVEGWQFSRTEFGVPEAAYQAADPAHWLALETAGRALADAGFPGGQGLPGDRAGVLLGNTLTGEVSRAATLRTQWPFVATVLEAALAAGAVPPAGRPRVLRHAAGAFAAPFPEPSPATLAGSQPGAIADRICRQFRFRGGGQAVDTAHSSALLAVAIGCVLLAAGELDFVLAGGVDVSLDPFELDGLAQAGLLTRGPMRIFDTSPTGFLPGEGCGIIALMRAADARAADMPSYADIVGWGTSSAGLPSNQLLALQRAYQRAAVPPADVQFIEGDGRGTADADLAELTALTTIRAGAPAAAALGSVKANIGHTKAAAGAAGLIKAALAVNAGVIPPVTGCVQPHPLLRESGAVLRVPRSAESWPGRTRLAAVSSIDPAGSTVHLVLRRERHHLAGPAQPPSTPPPPNSAEQPGTGRHPGTGQPRGGDQPAASSPGGQTLAAWSVPSVPPAEAFTFSGPDRSQLATLLSEVAAAAPGLSDAELSDLACQSGRETDHGPVRVALVATDQDELSRLCLAAASLLPSLRTGQLATRPGLFAADRAAGRVALLFPGELAAASAGQEPPGPAAAPAIAQSSLNALHWLDGLGLRAATAVGQGVGEITALVWSGSLAEATAVRLIAARAAALTTAGSRADRSAALREVLASTEFAAPARRLISAVTGREVTPGTDIRRLLCDQITEPVRLAEALRAVTAGVDLLLDTGPGEAMAGLAGDSHAVPVVSLAAGPTGPAAPAVAAALFAVGAAASLAPLLAGRPARRIDLSRPRVFITNPCAEVISAASGATSAPKTSATPASAPAASAAATSADPPTTAARGTAGRDTASSGRQPGTGARETSADSAGPGGTADPYPGVGPWIRCFTEELRPLPQPGQPVDEEPWRLHATTRQPFGRMAAEVFEDDPAATGVLAVIGDLADPDGSSKLIAAAREAAAAGSLVVITPTAGLAGFCASLQAEHPSLGITLIRTADSMDGLLAAQRFAATEPGRFRELVLDSAGRPREPVMVAAVAAGPLTQPSGRPAGVRLGLSDVVLVSGSPPGDLLAMAQLLAGSGARLALVGDPARPAEAAAVDLALAGLRHTGTEVSYATADISDPDQVEAVVTRIEQQAGPVTAVCYPASNGLRSGCTELPADQVRALISAQADGLSNLLGAISAARLRLLMTVSALPTRYGAARRGAASLSAAALAEQARRLGQGLPSCRVLHADLPWPPGRSPAAPAELGRLLMNALANGPAATRIALHGRPGRGTGAASADQPAGRFLETVRVHCPRVELVAEAQVSTRTDPYLADYLLDGRTVLPPAIGLESMAQAAAAVAGRPLRDLAEVSMEAPVLLPPGDGDTTLRVCALLRDDSVETVLRAAGTGFSLDHFRAIFPLRRAAGSPAAGSPAAGSPAAGSPATGHPGTSGTKSTGQRLGLGSAVPGSIVDGTDVYGTLCFQRGPFRRVAFLTEVTARSCRGLIRGADDRPWFTGPGQPAGSAAQRPDGTLILGSPGLNDAVMHMLQASIPDRRVLPAGFRSLTVTGREVCGAVQVRAERGAGPAGTWQVSASDAAGQAVLTLTGLRLREAGRLAQGSPWHPTLLAAAIEGRGAELGLDPALRVSLRCGLPPGPAAPTPPTDLPWVDTSAGRGPLTGFQLTAQASMPVACHWETTEPHATEKKQDAVAPPEELARQLRERYTGQPAAASARLRAITRCLAAAGWPNGAAPQLDAARDADWARIRAGKITVACTVAVLDGVPQPVAIALATWPAGDEPATGSPTDGGQSDARKTSVTKAGPPGRPVETGGSLGRPSDSPERQGVVS